MEGSAHINSICYTRCLGRVPSSYSENLVSTLPDGRTRRYTAARHVAHTFLAALTNSSTALAALDQTTRMRCMFPSFDRGKHAFIPEPPPLPDSRPHSPTLLKPTTALCPTWLFSPKNRYKNTRVIRAFMIHIYSRSIYSRLVKHNNSHSMIPAWLMLMPWNSPFNCSPLVLY